MAINLGTLVANLQLNTSGARRAAQEVQQLDIQLDDLVANGRASASSVDTLRTRLSTLQQELGTLVTQLSAVGSQQASIDNLTESFLRLAAAEQRSLTNPNAQNQTAVIQTGRAFDEARAGARSNLGSQASAEAIESSRRSAEARRLEAQGTQILAAAEREEAQAKRDGVVASQQTTQESQNLVAAQNQTAAAINAATSSLAGQDTQLQRARQALAQLAATPPPDLNPSTGAGNEAASNNLMRAIEERVNAVNRLERAQSIRARALRVLQQLEQTSQGQLRVGTSAYNLRVQAIRTLDAAELSLVRVNTAAIRSQTDLASQYSIASQRARGLERSVRMATQAQQRASRVQAASPIGPSSGSTQSGNLGINSSQVPGLNASQRSSLDSSIGLLRRLETEINDAANASDRQGQAANRAGRIQVAALQRAFTQLQQYTAAVQRAGLSTSVQNDLISQAVARHAALTNTLTNQRVNTLAVTRAQASYNAELATLRNQLRSYNVASTAATTSSSRLNNAFRNLTSASIFAVGPLSGIGARFNAFSQIVNRSTLAIGVFIASLVALGVVLFKVFQNAFRVGRVFERIEARLESATDTAFGFNASLLRLTRLAEQAGVEVRILSDSYSQFRIAARGSGLEGVALEEAFRDLTLSASAARIGTDDFEGAMRALIQILSKGTVQAEELRGQLGDRLFGAFNIAAEAIGVTTAELNDLLKAGGIISATFLPQFARAFREALGVSATDNIDNLQASTNRLTNEFTFFSQTVNRAFGIVSRVKSVIDATTGVVRSLDDNISLITRSLAALVALGVSLVIRRLALNFLILNGVLAAGVRAIVSFTVATISFRAATTGAITAIAALGANFATLLVGLRLSVATFGIATAALSLFGGASAVVGAALLGTTGTLIALLGPLALIAGVIGVTIYAFNTFGAEVEKITATTEEWLESADAMLETLRSIDRSVSDFDFRPVVEQVNEGRIRIEELRTELARLIADRQILARNPLNPAFAFNLNRTREARAEIEQLEARIADLELSLGRAGEAANNLDNPDFLDAERTVNNLQRLVLATTLGTGAVEAFNDQLGREDALRQFEDSIGKLAPALQKDLVDAFKDFQGALTETQRQVGLRELRRETEDLARANDNILSPSLALARNRTAEQMRAAEDYKQALIALKLPQTEITAALKAFTDEQARSTVADQVAALQDLSDETAKLDRQYNSLFRPTDLAGSDGVDALVQARRDLLESQGIDVSPGTQAFAGLERYRKRLEELNSIQADVTRTIRTGIESVAGAIGDSLGKAILELQFDFESLGMAFQQIAQQIISELIRILIIRAVVAPIANAIGFGPPGFAKGGVFQSGGVVKAFQSGGIIDGPTVFPIRGGTGIAGEAGPEAILPLQRDSSGRLGVIAAGGGGRTSAMFAPTINVNIGQATERDGAAIAKTIRQTIEEQTNQFVIRESRPGGVFARR